MRVVHKYIAGFKRIYRSNIGWHEVTKNEMYHFLFNFDVRGSAHVHMRQVFIAGLAVVPECV